MADQTRAESAVRSIVADLSDRRGLRQAWESIDEDVQEQISAGWTASVEVSISDAVAIEREECAQLVERSGVPAAHAIAAAIRARGEEEPRG